jgi:site-specific DNA-methyltransferase (adenine-specific)
MQNKILHGDCLELLKDIPDGSMDLILTDPPYGVLQCKWDTVIPLDKLWEQYKRVIRPDGAIVVFAAQPFTSALIMSNPKMYKYCWIWQKEQGSNFFAAKFQPMNNTEDIAVFGFGGINNGTKLPLRYFPQGVRKVNTVRKNSKTTGGLAGAAHNTSMKPGQEFVQEFENYPTKILQYKRDKGVKGETLIATQKPVALLEYLIRTYTLKGETVLDSCAGSGSTAIACIRTGRNYVMMEKDENHFNTIRKRVQTEMLENRRKGEKK